MKTKPSFVGEKFRLSVPPHNGALLHGPQGHIFRYDKLGPMQGTLLATRVWDGAQLMLTPGDVVVDLGLVPFDANQPPLRLAKLVDAMGEMYCFQEIDANGNVIALEFDSTRSVVLGPTQVFVAGEHHDPQS